MSNDPLGLFDEENDPLGLFDKEESTLGDKLLGGLDAAAAMVAGTPAQIAGGIYGLSTLLGTGDLDKANKALESVQESNFGLGAYKPATDKGAEYSQAVSGVLEKPVEFAGDLGERIAGNEGRLAGELWTRSAMEMIDPLVLAGVAGKAIGKRKPKFDPVKEEAPVAAPQKDPLGLFENLKATEGPDGQMALWDIDEGARMPNPYEAVTGDWRIDENGIPVKADLSMEANNIEAPLQRGLWGDELPAKTPQENLPITQGMDQTRNEAMSAEDLESAVAARQLMDEQQQLLSFDLPASPELRRAMMDAEIMTERSPYVDPRIDRKPTSIQSALPKSNPVIKNINRQENLIPDDPTPEALEEQLSLARTEKDGSSLKYMDSGAALSAMKRGSTAVRLAGELVNNAFKRADLAIRENVFPTERAIKSMSKAELTRLGDILKEEMFSGERMTLDKLNTLTPKMLVSYKKLRETFDDALRIQNEARATKGQPPVTPMEAYLSSRWQGDFRRPLYDSEGKLVWYLASDSKAGLNAQTRAVLKDFPELTYDPGKDHTVRFSNRKTDLESAYSTMLDILGRDDPAVMAIQKYMEDQTVGRGATFLNQEKHFKKKGNVRGFIGDRPSLTVNDYVDKNIPFGDRLTLGHSKKNEALAMLQQQIQYAKNAYRWSELQKSGQSLKKIINDPDLVRTQPENIKYIREYYKNAIGYGESRATRAISDSLRDIGVSPTPFDKGVGSLKSFFILQKLAGNIGKLTADVVQLSMTAPHMVDLWKKGYKGNIPKAISAGLLGGITMGTGHVAGYLGKKPHDIPGFEFYNKAQKYAEDNGVTARSIYDESPIENSFSATGRVADLAGRTMTIPETYVRSMAFMTYAQFLKDSKKFKNDTDLFKEAERLTNVSMVDYSPTERPMIFSKLGTTGNFLNTLQTYSFNFYNQYSYFMREAAKGNWMPLAAAISMQYMVAGAMGIPGFEDINDIWRMVKDAMPAKQWKKVQESEFLSNPKLWMLNHMGESSLYGFLSDKTGVGITSRVAAPTTGQMMQSPAGPIMDIGKQAGALASAVADPTNTTKWAQSAMLSAPVGVQGLLETSPMMEGITHNKRMVDGQEQIVYNRPTKLLEREALNTRTPKEENIRRWGFRSQREIVERDVNYETKRNTIKAREKAATLPEAFYDALRRGKTEDAKEYYQTYVYLTGNKLSKEQILNQAKEEFLTDIERQKLRAKTSVQALINLKRMEDTFDAIEKENQ